MMENRKLTEKLIAAFSYQNAETFLNYLADDVVWKLVGMHTAYSKDEVRKIMGVLSDFKILESDILQIVSDNGLVSVQGTVKVEIPGENNLRTVEYAGYFRITDGLVTEIVSFSNSAGAINEKTFMALEGTTYINTFNGHKISN